MSLSPMEILSLTSRIPEPHEVRKMKVSGFRCWCYSIYGTIRLKCRSEDNAGEVVIDYLRTIYDDETTRQSIRDIALNAACKFIGLMNDRSKHNIISSVEMDVIRRVLSGKKCNFLKDHYEINHVFQQAWTEKTKEALRDSEELRQAE